MWMPALLVCVAAHSDGRRTVDGDSIDSLAQEVLMHHVHVPRALGKHEHWRRSLLNALSDALQLVLRLHVFNFLHTSQSVLS